VPSKSERPAGLVGRRGCTRCSAPVAISRLTRFAGDGIRARQRAPNTSSALRAGPLPCR
jgi:hypothetical protein